MFPWFAWKYSKIFPLLKNSENCRMHFSLLLNTWPKLQLTAEVFFFLCMCVFHGVSSACVSRSVTFPQSDTKHFQCKTMPRTQSWWEGKASQSTVIYLLSFDTLVCSSCFNGLRFSLHCINPVYHKIEWCFRISFHKKGQQWNNLAVSVL